MAVEIAEANSRATTPTIITRHSQIENSPKPLQNARFLETLSKTLCPCLVLTIKTTPSILEISYWSSTPVSSSQSSVRYHTVTTTMAQSGIPNRYNNDSVSRGNK